MSKKNAIFFSCNERFIFTLAIALLSLKKHCAELLKTTDVLVYYQGFTEADKTFLNSITPCIFKEYHFAVETDFENINFSMLSATAAVKTGYNFEFLKRHLIVQPAFLASYSFINTFNYTTASNVRINAEPLHALQLEPRIKLTGNFKKYLQPYICVSMVWNTIDHAKFQANDVYLPDISVEPFVQYGAGVQKRYGERVTGFFETLIRNGGRSGIALLFGLRISI